MEYPSEDGVPVETKRKELSNEYSVYCYAQSLQGKTIPNCLSLLKYFGGVVYILYTEYAGESLHEVERNDDYLVSLVCTGAKKALSSLHDIGILHGDIRVDNFVFEKENLGHVFILDFGFAQFREQIGPDKWQILVNEEKKKLNEELNNYFNIGKRI
jgi:tRNA A-37 threonylcarbamoyl transferase component Bud32